MDTHASLLSVPQLHEHPSHATEAIHATAAISAQTLLSVAHAVGKKDGSDSRTV